MYTKTYTHTHTHTHTHTLILHIYRTDNGGAVIETSADSDGVSETDIQVFTLRPKKGQPAEIASALLPGITDGLKKATWKV